MNGDGRRISKRELAAMTLRYKIHLLFQQFCPILFVLVFFFLIILWGMSNSVQMATGCPLNHYSAISIQKARKKLVNDPPSEQQSELREGLLK